MLDAITQFLNVFALALIAKFEPLFHAYKALVLLRVDGMPVPGMALCIIGHTIACAIKTRESQGEKRYYWLHSLVLVVLNSFGGGILAYMALGKPAIILTNELILPTCIVIWYFTHYLGGCSLMNIYPCKLTWSIFDALFRAHGICNIVSVATKSLSATDYYPYCPMVGPILAGCLIGGVGMFMPFDKGLKPISDGTPWPLQGAFMSAFFYHTIIHDKTGPIGMMSRNILGSYNESTARLIIGSVWISSTIAQNFFDSSANMFTPFHKFLYLIFQVDGPGNFSSKQKVGTNVGWDYRTRLILERWIELSRVLIAVACISFHIYYNLPPVRIDAGSTVPVTMHTLDNGSRPLVGNCQLFSSFRSCTPTSMSMYTLDKGNYQLAVKNKKGDVSWTYDLPYSLKATEVAKSLLDLKLSDMGQLTVTRTMLDSTGKIDTIVSKNKCSGVSTVSDLEKEKKSKSRSKVYLAIEEGKPTIVCSATEKLTLTF